MTRALALVLLLLAGIVKSSLPPANSACFAAVPNVWCLAGRSIHVAVYDEIAIDSSASAFGAAPGRLPFDVWTAAAISYDPGSRTVILCEACASDTVMARGMFAARVPDVTSAGPRGATLHFVPLAPLPKPRRGSTVVALGGVYYVVGNMTSPGVPYSSTGVTYDAACPSRGEDWRERPLAISVHFDFVFVGRLLLQPLHHTNSIAAVYGRNSTRFASLSVSNGTLLWPPAPGAAGNVFVNRAITTFGRFVLVVAKQGSEVILQMHDPSTFDFATVATLHWPWADTQPLVTVGSVVWVAGKVHLLQEVSYLIATKAVVGRASYSVTFSPLFSPEIYSRFLETTAMRLAPGDSCTEDVEGTAARHLNTTTSFEVTNIPRGNFAVACLSYGNCFSHGTVCGEDGITSQKCVLSGCCWVDGACRHPNGTLDSPNRTWFVATTQPIFRATSSLSLTESFTATQTKPVSVSLTASSVGTTTATGSQTVTTALSASRTVLSSPSLSRTATLSGTSVPSASRTVRLSATDTTSATFTATLALSSSLSQAHTQTPPNNTAAPSSSSGGPGSSSGPGRRAASPPKTDAYEIALIAVCCALGVVFVVLAVLYAFRRFRTTPLLLSGDDGGGNVPFGSYRTLQTLGHGGEGQVVLAAADDGVKFALKRIACTSRFEVMQQFNLMQRAAAATPHVCRPLKLYLPDLPQGNENRPLVEYAHIKMEYIDSGDLQQYIERWRSACLPIPEDALLSVAAQVGDGLAAMHTRIHPPIMHGDLKPQNVLLRTRGALTTLHIIDFGSACEVRTMSSRHKRASSTGDLDERQPRLNSRSTPQYAAPERFQSNPVACVSIDVFSLGVMLYVMCTRDPQQGIGPRIALDSDTDTEELLSQLHQEVVVAGYAPEIADLVIAAIAPAHRRLSAAQVADRARRLMRSAESLLPEPDGCRSTELRTRSLMSPREGDECCLNVADDER